MNLAPLLLFLQLAHTHKSSKPPRPATPPAAVQDGIFGTWMARDKSVVSIFPCGVTNGQAFDPKEACVRLLEPSAHVAPDTPDARNPDPQKRQHPLRLSVVGTGFKVVDPADATGGKLYDADNGRTYKSSIALKNNELRLHGTRFLFFGHTLTCHRIGLAKPSPYKP